MTNIHTASEPYSVSAVTDESASFTNGAFTFATNRFFLKALSVIRDQTGENYSRIINQLIFNEALRLGFNPESKRPSNYSYAGHNLGANINERSSDD